MEERRTIRTQGQVIEEYRRGFPAEVVETYRRGPAAAPAEPEAAPEHISPPEKSSRGLTVFLAVLVSLSILTLAAVLYVRLRPAARPHREPSGYSYEELDPDEEIGIPAYPTGEGAAMEVLSSHGRELTAGEIYARVNPAVVTVVCKGQSAGFVGTGVIFREDGYILTNWHIVSGGRQCAVLLDEDVYLEARYVASDAENDLAVLKVDAEGLPVAEFGDSDLLAVGDPVYAIGTPLSIELRGTMTNGIISAVDREVDVGDHTMTLIQTNAALNNGNSGGPLINCYGQVVGINVIKMYSSYSTVEGLGFAIPSASMEKIVNDLLAYGELQPEPLLGFSVYREADRLPDGRWGLEVAEVAGGCPAEAAGIRAGDYVLAVDGRETLRSETVLKVRRRHHLGDELVVTLWREGAVFDVTLHLTTAVE